MQEELSYGQALPDQVERIAGFFDAHLILMSDVRELYRERAALERDYAIKLQALTKKAIDKKGKLDTVLAVGEDPAKTWDDSTVGRNTLNAAYTALVEAFSGASQDHISIADALSTQVVDVLRNVEQRGAEAKKKEMQFFQKLMSDRDRIYADRLKSKNKYDEECTEVETYRQKQSRAADDRHAGRAAKQAEQQRNDMLNSKNVYIISTAIANVTKTKFFEDDLRVLEDQFQALQTKLVERFTKILQHSQALQLTHLDHLKGRINSLGQALSRVVPARDQALFIEYNIRPFTAPSDWNFEPCATFYDTNEMSVEPAPKIFLQNKLGRCRAKLTELSPLLEEKRKESERLVKKHSAYNADHTVGSIDDLGESYLEAAHQLALYTVSERILKVEIAVIIEAVGDDHGARYPHAFKSTAFSIPTTCGYCKSSIWGLSKQGKTCKTCGLSVHTKCELKVPADCQHPEVGVPLTGTIPRKETEKENRASREEPPSASSFVRPVEPEEANDNSDRTARVLFDFTASSEFELDVSEGSMVKVLELDDGSGWIKVASTRGQSGLVPASYIEFVDSGAVSGTPDSTQKVRAIYGYQSQGQDELGLTEGEIIELTSGPSGGQNYGDGWWEGINTRGEKGIFPSNYVDLL